jgi:hypothetical protein
VTLARVCASHQSRSDVGAGQRGGVVHAIADHRDPPSSGVQLGHLRVLVLRQDLGGHLGLER